MTSFVQLSDLHIRKSNDRDENRALTHIVNHLINHYPGADKPLVLLTGDLVDDGRRDQYQNAVALLRPLKDAGFTLLAAPGNHDYGPMGNLYTERAQNHFQQFILRQLLERPDADSPANIMDQLYPRVDPIAGHNGAPDVAFIGLDTCEVVEDLPLRFAAGAVGETQLATLAQALDALPEDRVRVVYMHHHPFERVPGMQMSDASAFMSVIAGRVDLVCFGHKHVAAVWNDRLEAEWMIAAGKTTEPALDGRLRLRHVEIHGRDRFTVRNLVVEDPNFADTLDKLGDFDPAL